MSHWERLVVVGTVIAIAALLAAIVDRWLGRRQLEPATITRYRVLRRSIGAAIVSVGAFSALLVIPQVRAVATGILASSAVIGIVVGFAARTTLANVIAGVMIAFTQPLRLGDVIETGGARGVVEEIDLIYTFIRLPDGSRLVIPNEKLASDTIRNYSIRGDRAIAEISVQIPLEQDLGQLVSDLTNALADTEGREVYVRELTDTATVCVCASASDSRAAERLENELRLRVHGYLRERGTFS
jgi:small-conductance mechanosensitive channel